MSKVLETRQFAELILRGAEAIEASLTDGKFTFMDFPRFVPVLALINEALDGAKKIPAELASLTDEGRAELFAVIDTLKLENPAYEKIGEELIKTMLGIFNLIGLIKDAKKK